MHAFKTRVILIFTNKDKLLNGL